MSIITIASIPPIEIQSNWIGEIGTWEIGSGGLSPSLEIGLYPGRGELASLLDPPPVRMRATLTMDDGTTFSGIVQAVRLGSSPSITLET